MRRQVSEPDNRGEQETGASRLDGTNTHRSAHHGGGRTAQFLAIQTAVTAIGHGFINRYGGILAAMAMALIDGESLRYISRSHRHSAHTSRGLHQQHAYNKAEFKPAAIHNR